MRNNYKLLKVRCGMSKERDFYKYSNKMRFWNTKGQVSIFVIVALVIVGLVAAFYFLGDRLPFGVSGELNPEPFLKDCIQPEVEDAITTLSAQGGYSNPEGFVLDNDIKIKYLCYTSEYYRQCVVQQPLITEHMEKEVEDILTPKMEVCMDNLKKEYNKRNIDATFGGVEADFKIELYRMDLKFIAPIVLIENEERRTFDGFEVRINSKMGEILDISKELLEYEATYGDSDTLKLMVYHPNNRIDKRTLGDGTVIYIVSDIETEESFTFASRSLVWPPGYGL